MPRKPTRTVLSSARKILEEHRKTLREAVAQCQQMLQQAKAEAERATNELASFEKEISTLSSSASATLSGAANATRRRAKKAGTEARKPKAARRIRRRSRGDITQASAIFKVVEASGDRGIRSKDVAKEVQGTYKITIGRSGVSTLLSGLKRSGKLVNRDRLWFAASSSQAKSDTQGSATMTFGDPLPDGMET